MSLLRKSRDLARGFRRDLGLCNEPVDLFTVCNVLDLRIERRRLPEGITAAISRKKRIILLEVESTLGHQHFSVAHELCHYILANPPAGCRPGLFEDQNCDTERLADRFAAELLMPAADLRAQVRGTSPITPATIMELQGRYGVSWAAMTIRLQQLGYISDREHARYRRFKVRNVARAMGYDLTLLMPSG